MTNQEILEIAMEQSAADLNCKAEDFFKTEPVVVRGGIGPGAKKYYQEPVSANLVSYGNNIVASVKEEYQEVIEEYLHKFTFYHCFETPNIHWLEDKLRKEGQSCFMAEYYLPDINKVKPLSCEYSLKILHQEDFAELYKPEWSNALCKERKHLDVLGVGAYDGKKLVGRAQAYEYMCIFSVNNITVPGTAKIRSNFQKFNFLPYCLAKMYGQIFKISIFYRTVCQKRYG